MNPTALVWRDPRRTCVPAHSRSSASHTGRAGLGWMELEAVDGAGGRRGLCVWPRPRPPIPGHAPTAAPPTKPQDVGTCCDCPEKGLFESQHVLGRRQGLSGWVRRDPQTWRVSSGRRYPDGVRSGRGGAGTPGWASAPGSILGAEPGTQATLPGPPSPMLADSDEIFK